MTASHNDELIEELRNLRRRLATETIELHTREEALRDQKQEVRDLRNAIDEVLEEIETGRTGRPLLDAASRPADPAPPVEERPGGAPAEHLCDLHGGRPWTDEELDRLLVHACRHYDRGMAEFWSKATESGADDGVILFFLRQRWPNSRVFVGPDATHQKHGYTIQGSPDPRLWVGPYLGHNHRPTLGGMPLVQTVRRVMGIPSPADVAPRSGIDLVTSHPGSSPATNGVDVPEKPEAPKKTRKRKETI